MLTTRTVPASVAAEVQQQAIQELQAQVEALVAQCAVRKALLAAKCAELEELRADAAESTARLEAHTEDVLGEIEALDVELSRIQKKQ